jgi:hypothetical protein
MSSLARQLVLDEIFDLSLYRALRDVARGKLRDVLDELIAVETQHVAYWQRFFGLENLTKLDAGRRLKLGVLKATCRLFGAGAIQVVLEAIEVHGVRKYLKVWKRFQGHPLGGAVRGILEDEFKHEDMLVTGAADRRINPEKVRNVFLGLNDGLVEILGAVSGFFAAFGNPVAVLAAGSPWRSRAPSPWRPAFTSPPARRPRCARRRTSASASSARRWRTRRARALSPRRSSWAWATRRERSCRSSRCSSGLAACSRPCSRGVS